MLIFVIKMKYLKSITFIFWLTGGLCPGFAQNIYPETVLAKYLAVKEQIAQNQLFLNAFQFQPGRLASPQWADYHRSEKYWFRGVSGSRFQLSLVEVIIDSGFVHQDIAFFYDEDERLAYLIEKQNDPALPYRELRIFFEGQTILRLEEDQAIINSSTIFYQKRLARLREMGQFLLEKFKDYQQYARP
ncbi:MAG: hypothetical protein HC913_20160 [Microscillaceae bacterium]|nr:hypothetical protein [Microscillaceae bacterium]